VRSAVNIVIATIAADDELKFLVRSSAGNLRRGEVVTLVAALMVYCCQGNPSKNTGICDAVALLTSLCSWPETSVDSTISMVSPSCTQCD
jgi:hypothetical protein